MTSPLPPRRRDSRNLADLIRQDRQNLKQLGVGFAGGRFPPARQLHPVYDGDDADEGDATDEVAFRNADRVTVTVARTVTLNLTYVPIDGSLHVRWNGIDQPPAEWTLVGQSVIFNDPHLHVGDVLTAAYAYYPSDVPEVLPPAFVGGNSASTATSGTIGNLALPAGTQAGDLIIVAVRANASPAATNSDSRMTNVFGPGGVMLFVGNEDGSGNPVAITASGTNGSAMVLGVFTQATTATLMGSVVSGSASSFAMPTGTASNVVAVVCEQVGFGADAGVASVPAGYDLTAYPGTVGYAVGKDAVGMWHWLTDGPDTTSPAGTVTLTANDAWTAFLLEIT